MDHFAPGGSGLLTYGLVAKALVDGRFQLFLAWFG